MRKFAFALVVATALLPVLAFAQERRTPRCKLLYGNYEYENRNWDKLEAELILVGACPTTTTLATTTTTGGTTSTTGATTTTTAAVTTTTTTTLLASNPAAPPMGTTEDFAILAGSTHTCTGVSDVDCDIGLDPGTSVVGYPTPCTQSAGQTHVNDAQAIQAKTDLTTAYNDLAGRVSDGTISGDIGGQTFTRGVYTSATSVDITGTVTLSGSATDIFIFQIGTTLTTATSSVVALTGGAVADNVYWQVGSSATLGISSVMNGNILADQSITGTTSAVVNGRLLASVAAVTLDTNIVNAPASCVP